MGTGPEPGQGARRPPRLPGRLTAPSPRGRTCSRSSTRSRRRRAGSSRSVARSHRAHREQLFDRLQVPEAALRVDSSGTMFAPTDLDQTAVTSFERSSASCGASDPLGSLPRGRPRSSSCRRPAGGGVHVPTDCPSSQSRRRSRRQCCRSRRPSGRRPACGASSIPVGSHDPPPGRYAAWIVQPWRPTLAHTAAVSPRASIAIRGAWASRPPAESEVGIPHVPVFGSRSAVCAIRFLPSKRSHTATTFVPAIATCGEAT